MSTLKNLKYKKLIQLLQDFKKSKKEEDEKYEAILAPESFNTVINTVLVEERVKDVIKLSRKFKFNREEGIKFILQPKNEEMISLINSVDENELLSDTEPAEVVRPVFTKTTYNKKTFYEKENDSQIYDENMKVIGEIKIKKEYVFYKELKK